MDVVPFGYDPLVLGDHDNLQDSCSSFFDQEDTTAFKTGSLRNEYNRPSVLVDWMIQHSNFQHSVSPPEIEHVNPSFPFASSDLLNRNSKAFKMPMNKKVNHLNDQTIQDRQRLSTEEIVRLAGEIFIEHFTNKVDGFCTSIHPYASSISSGLTLDQAKDVELVQLLLAAAENTGSQKFHVTNKLISHCLWMASDSVTPIQRLSFYFASALQEKIQRECGNGMRTYKQKHEPMKREKGLVLGTDNVFLTSHKELPFSQLLQFTGIQSILENFKESRKDKIHLIDLQIRSGIQWAALMQGIVEYHKIKHVKITAIGTIGQKCVEETGTRLMSFAKSLNLSFSFEAVYVNDMEDFREDILKIEDDEVVVVYSSLMLRSMLSNPDRLEDLMRGGSNQTYLWLSK